MLPATHKAIVIGAGPGGLAAVKSLLDSGVNKICWIDRKFGGGRLNELYREISSNTKVKIYLDAVTSSPTCQRIIENTPKPNAITALERYDREATCQLSVAGDMVKMLEKGLLRHKGVEKVVDYVKEARLEGSTWKVGLFNSSSSPISASRLFLCTGSHPIIPSFHKPYNADLEVLDLDKCMVKSSLPSLFPQDRKSVVGVIGNSHSGVLAVRNLFEIHNEGKRDLKIMNFRRSDIQYAIYREDGIVNDNTGLKGDTADWSKIYMEDQPNGQTKGDKGETVIEQIDISKNEKEIYGKRLKECTHLIYAIGYQPNPYPTLFVDGKEIKQDDLEFDQDTSEFSLNGQKVRGLYGLGIAHPEKTEDPEGKVESAVGLAKFFAFGDKNKDRWAKDVQHRSR
ncbi:uncharacterized protein I303_108086 [Kwoniella dejecticola CBS 10117]|uniref:Uncharacterized protein n=1 Tax=Kwoniella dejecticola CBS 10117 TaxID=1296121 RepID=A0A1A5ZWH8_9TREE|nr:uncharacterized protein I303_08077 [Kwoniella dejecticola CBS 10117]OBR82163.1 hypothetical protein I303_08077 [Kwoniella dejecticola CBS 10117]